MLKVRSPLFYVGDKYKLMPELVKIMPKNINQYFDVFVGGGSSSLAINAKKYYFNDISTNIINLHKFLRNKLININDFLNHMYLLIDKYNLTCSARRKFPSNFQKYKELYIKTYYAKLNKSGYLKLRDDYNKEQSNLYLLYLLLVFGFNHMIRFNKEGKFNLPVGNVDWNKNVEKALDNYSNFIINNRNIYYSNFDFENFINHSNFEQNDYLYFDPPYLITFSEYNKLWDEYSDIRLYKLLDYLNKENIHWGLSNVISHKGKTNNILIEWMNRNKYYSYPIKSNYISRFDNSIKQDTKEIFITNFKDE